jgi:hypothetical protein
MIDFRIRMKGLRHFPFVCVTAIGMIQGLYAQDTASATATNMRVYQSLAASLADTAALLIPAADSGRIGVKIAPADVGWFLQDAVERPFRARGFRISANDSGGYAMEFGALLMKVRYANVRRDGVFGSRILDRSVVLTARLRLVDRARGSVLLSVEKESSFDDTIPLSQVDVIEHAAVPVTRGTLPPEDFFSGLVEPLVIVGAVAVAIFLLFTVRS